MDPITAISLAAAVAQFVEIDIKVAGRMNGFSIAIEFVPQAFQQTTTTLPLIADGLRKEGQRVNEGSVDSERVLKQQHSDTLNCTTRLADLLDELDQYKKAIELFQEVYEVRKGIFGPINHTLVAENDLASMFCQQNGARPKGSHRTTLISVLNLIWALHYVADNGESESAEFEVALELARQSLLEARGGLRKNNEKSQLELVEAGSALEELEQLLIEKHNETLTEDIKD
ncbi:short-chain dehydrogenase [Paramyrothecium foliicola]|nr:short-chain dehydrogenase [Paramyrothecium foliicola]